MSDRGVGFRQDVSALAVVDQIEEGVADVCKDLVHHWFHNA